MQNKKQVGKKMLSIASYANHSYLTMLAEINHPMGWA